MSATDIDLVNTSIAVAEYAEAQLGGPYIYGATADKCTIGNRLRQAEQYPEMEDKIRENCPALSGEGTGCSGCKWNGRLAFDCATLTRFAAEAAGLSLPSGATSQWNKGDWVASGLISSLPREFVCFVYRKRDGKMVHTGIYLPDGTVIEARGHKDGVIRGEASDYPWTHWAILDGMAHPEDATLLQDQPVLRKGDRGDEVKLLQEALISAGYPCGDAKADGVFGKDTRTAVMELQRDAGIERDGVVGEQTWAALDKLSGSTRYTVTISGVNRTVADRIVRDYGGEVTEDV